jgi:hypothetical protein
MYTSHRACYAHFLGPKPNYSIYNRILETHQGLKQRQKYQLLLLTSEGFPIALYLLAGDRRACDELLALGYWQVSNLPRPRHHFPLTSV